LAKHSDAPLPGTVESLLGDVTAKHGRIHIGNASHYLTVDDPHLLVELKADKKLNELRFHTLSPTVALVQGQNLARIRDLLHSAGHMPVADGYLDPPATEGDGDGPDLPFADGGDDDDYVIDLDRMPTEEELAALAELAGRGGALSLMPTPAPPRPRFTEPLEATTPVRGRAEIVALLNTALDRGARVELEYRGRTGGFAAKTLRKVDVAAIDEQYVFGYCHLRHDDREFEIKRISAARLTGEPSH